MSDPSATWSMALKRFGFGARGVAAPASGDPRAAIEAELAASGAGRLEEPGLMSSQQALVALYEYNARQNEARAKADALRGAMTAMPAPAVAAAMIAPGGETKPAEKPPNPIEDIFAAEALARIKAAAAPAIGFTERLVAFWSNHFCISAAKGGAVRVLAGAFEREAIRPYVLGKFADMLQAVERHPAMLHYLDNAQSVGPDSPRRAQRQAGLERESRARNPGASHARRRRRLRSGRRDRIRPRADRLDASSAPTGGSDRRAPSCSTPTRTRAARGRCSAAATRTTVLRKARAMLDDLARSPATARHIAAKFARAFVADDPPPPLVARLADVFAKTDGDLGALARALVADDLAWSAPATKLRDPWEMCVAAVRALDLDPHPSGRIAALARAARHAAVVAGRPERLSRRRRRLGLARGHQGAAEVAAVLGRVRQGRAAAGATCSSASLPDASSETREAVLHAESRAQSYALLHHGAGVPEEMRHGLCAA